MNSTLTTSSYIFNASNVTENTTQLDETIEFKNIYYEHTTTWVIQITIRPILIVCETIFNMLPFHIMRRGSLNLALADTVNN